MLCRLIISKLYQGKKQPITLETTTNSQREENVSQVRLANLNEENVLVVPTPEQRGKKHTRHEDDQELHNNNKLQKSNNAILIEFKQMVDDSFQIQQSQFNVGSADVTFPGDYLVGEGTAMNYSFHFLTDLSGITPNQMPTQNTLKYSLYFLMETNSGGSGVTMYVSNIPYTGFSNNMATTSGSDTSTQINKELVEEWRTSGASSNFPYKDRKNVRGQGLLTY